MNTDYEYIFFKTLLITIVILMVVVIIFVLTTDVIFDFPSKEKEIVEKMKKKAH